MTSYLLRAFVSLWLILVAAAHSFCQSSAAQAIPVDGQPFGAKLQTIDDQWNLQLVTPASEVKKLSAADLVQWGTWPEAKGTKQVVLANGGMLVVAEMLGIKNDKLVAESDTLASPTVRLPISSVAGLIYQAPLDRARRDLLEDRLLTATSDSDRVLLTNGDELSGTIAALSDKALQLKTVAGTTPVDVSRLTALIFNPSLRAKQPVGKLSAWVGLRDGSRLYVSKLVIKSGQAELKLTTDVLIRVPLDEIVAIQPVGSKVVYLSELTATGYRHIPFLNLPWEYQKNRSAGGIALRAGGQRHLMGLGMHSAARLTYDLDAPYRRFEASLAIDDETAGRGSVIGRVFTDDGSGQWKSAYESPIIRGGQAPARVNVDLTGAKRISLLIDFANRGDEGDHADWLNARLVKP
jgi:hypothetical protein